MTSANDTVLISDRLFDLAHRHPDRELVYDPVYGRFSYRGIATQTERLAFGLRRLGIGPGDIVVLQLPNWLPFIVFHLALTAIGAITVNAPVIYRERELKTLFEVTKAKGLVVPRMYGKDDFLPMAKTLFDETPSLKHLFIVGRDGGDVPQGMTGYEALMENAWEKGGGRNDLSSLRAATNETTVISFTSGTTGVMKGAMLSTDNLRAWNTGLAERYGLNEEDRIFCCSPLGHAVGFGHCLRMSLTIGCGMVLLDRWSATKALELISEERCTFVAGATPFLMDLVYHPELEAYGNLPSLRLFLCGGASIPEQLILDADKALPHTFVTPLWGMTECGGVTTCPFDAPPLKRFTTDGKPCDSMQLKIVDSGGQPVAPGEKGELLARGPMLSLGYFHLPELTAGFFQEDGFFRTGDQACMDEDGYIKITGRIKDLIIRGGVNISPVEVENVLFSHPNVANVAIVGVPDVRLGERVGAFIITRDGHSLGLPEVQRWMADAGLAKSKWPEWIECVGELPMTPSGKIQKFRLRQQITGA